MCIRDSIRSALFLDGRLTYIYTPPGYEGSSARYPVLYVQDAELMFDAAAGRSRGIGVDALADSLIASASLRPLIIVGVASAGGANRESEYTPFVRSYGDSTG